MNFLGDLEDAMSARLKEIEGVKTLELFTGQFNPDDLEDMAWRFPCIYLTVGGLSFTDQNRQRQVSLSILGLVGDRNARGDQAAKRGDAQSVGAYTLLQRLYEAFDNFRFRNSMAPFKIIRLDPVLHDRDKGLCVWRIEFEGKILLDLEEY